MNGFLSFVLIALLAQNTMTDLILTDADAGSTHEVRRGETVDLRLTENPSTGYRWALDIEPREAATVIESRWTPAGPGVGAAGTRAFTIAVNELGAVRLNAKLWREWQGEGSVITRQSFALQVH